MTNRITSLLILIASLFVSQQLWSAPRLPSENRECATCHIMWLKDFKRKDVETLVPYDPQPVVKTGKQDVASTEDMCFSCHDGFVLESRSLWETGKHAHPVGQKPSDKITIPVEDGKNIFPLNEDGRMYCGTCHSAHGVDWDDKESTIFMRVRDVDGELCMACHENKTKGPESGSHPILKKVHHKPEKLVKAGAKFGKKDEVVCQSCHKPHAAPEKKLLRIKNSKSELCGQCHDDRYGETMADAARLKTHPVNVKPVNAHISKSLLKNGSKHGANGEVICQSCHRPHDAKSKQGLLVKKNDHGLLCQSCHQDKKTVLNSKHDMNLVDEDSQNSREEKVKDAGACSACHVPHKGSGPKMWARSVDKNQEPMAALCLSCHSEKGLAEKHTVGEFSHPVGVDVKNIGHKVSLPTFSTDGLKWKDVLKGKVSCASCHDPHQWDANDKHHKAKPGDKGSNKNRFLRVANGASAELCKTCHIDKWNVTGSKHDMRLMAPRSKNSQGQTVFESSLCGACHLVHNANGSKLWARTNLEGKGTGYVACLGCHNETGLAKNKTLGIHSHPLNVDVKKLGIEAHRDKWTLSEKSSADKVSSKSNIVALPLYDKNGHPADHDGQVGCGTCHDPHNWSVSPEYKNENQHVKDLEGDANSSFLRLADNAQSQLCVNCHQDKKSVFSTRHDLTDQSIKHSEADNSKTESVQPVTKENIKGACLHCHKPHNAGENALWARTTGDAETPVGKMCASCHQKEKIAGKKLPGNHTHPVGVDIGDLEPHRDIPLFDDEGNRTAYAYQVDCASCHNPHQWDPNNKQNRGPSLSKEEGDTTNSFLRASANNNSELCVRCHNDKKMIVGTDHDFSKTAGNSLNQKRDVSGVCGQCHVPHHGVSDLYLWSQPLGKGQDPVEQRCRSCHAEFKQAADKNPKAGQHPKQIKIWSTELRNQIHEDKDLPDIRAFDENGRQAAFGAVTCASCHNPHQWQAFHQQAKPGKKEEGNVMTSFLRNNDSQNIVCADCHDQDGLYRYKYFHSKSTHQAK